MSWLSNFLGLKKLETPAVTDPEKIASMNEFESTAYLMDFMRKSGFEQTIQAGGRKPKSKLASPSYLSAI